jgi:hypothetical protein
VRVLNLAVTLKNDLKTHNYLFPVTVVTKMVYCVKELFSRMAGELKNLDTGKARVLLFSNFCFYMPDKNVFGIAWILDRSIEIY